MRLLSEPTAAALGHGAHRGADRRYLVCDLGGGTFDVAAVDVEAGVFEVLATTGDPFLGGDDVDRAIVENLVRDVRADARHRRLDRRVRDRAAAARRAAREARAVAIAPTRRSRCRELAAAAVGQGRSTTRAPMRRDELELWSSPLVKRLEAPIKEALRALRPPARRDRGGAAGRRHARACRRCASELARITGREPSVIANPEEVVAVGAALEVARLDGTIEGVLLIDVAARGLSMSTRRTATASW